PSNPPCCWPPLPPRCPLTPRPQVLPWPAEAPRPTRSLGRREPAPGLRLFNRMSAMSVRLHFQQVPGSSDHAAIGRRIGAHEALPRMSSRLLPRLAAISSGERTLASALTVARTTLIGLREP